MRGLFLHEGKRPNNARSHPHPSPPPQAGEGARPAVRSTDKCDQSSTAAHARRKSKISAKTRAPTSREVARSTGTSNAKCRITPLMKPLTRGGCPNGEPSGARSEFCRVPPHSKRFLVTFWRKQKVTPPPGGTPGTRKQPPSRSQKQKKKACKKICRPNSRRRTTR